MRQKLQSKEILWGATLTRVAAPPIVELYGMLGLDFVWIDMEHSDFDFHDFRRSHRFLGGGSHFSSDHFPRFDSFRTFDRSDFRRQRNEIVDHCHRLAFELATDEFEGRPIIFTREESRP